jgi:hypothetical protein
MNTKPKSKKKLRLEARIEDAKRWLRKGIKTSKLAALHAKRYKVERWVEKKAKWNYN